MAGKIDQDVLITSRQDMEKTYRQLIEHNQQMNAAAQTNYGAAAAGMIGLGQPAFGPLPQPAVISAAQQAHHRASSISAPSTPGIFTSVKERVEAMIKSHKDAIEGLEQVLALANMAEASNNTAAKQLLDNVIQAGLTAVSLNYR